MGRFVNPDNEAFRIALNSEIYIRQDLLNIPTECLIPNRL